MAQFVLVHGSFHGAWCWERLIHAAGGEGPSRRSRRTCRRAATTLRPPRMPISTAMRRASPAPSTALPGRVVLVGHSMGGIVAAQVSELRAHRLAATLYINGLLLRAGESLVSFLDAHGHLGVEDLVLKNMRVSPDGTTATFPPRRRRRCSTIAAIRRMPRRPPPDCSRSA